MKKELKIRFVLVAYESRSLEKAVKQIIMAAKKAGAHIVGPVPLPNRERIITVNRSPHIDKKSREQFSLTKHKRLLELVSTYPEKTMDELMKINIPSSVDIKILSNGRG
jgi:small subunit ribosomal protein S10